MNSDQLFNILLSLFIGIALGLIYYQPLLNIVPKTQITYFHINSLLSDSSILRMLAQPLGDEGPVILGIQIPLLNWASTAACGPDCEMGHPGDK